MHRIIAIPTALLISLAALAGPSVTSRPASAPAASQPTEAPAVPVKRIDAILAKLMSDKYAVRRDARAELMKIVELPGVAVVLKDRLARTEDAEVRASLQNVLAGHDLPLAMFWYRRGPGRTYHPPGAPWLLIRWDGTYLIDVNSPLLIGKSASSPTGDWRTGKLHRKELSAVKAVIAKSGLAKMRYATRNPSTAAIQMTCYVRSGSRTSLWVGKFVPKNLDPKRKPQSKPRLDTKLAVTLRNILAKRASKPYEGPLALRIHTSTTLKVKRYTRGELGDLPEWPVEAIKLTDVRGRMRGIPLKGEQLKAVRAALAKTDIYKASKYSPCQVFLAPYDDQAAKIMYPVVK